MLYKHPNAWVYDTVPSLNCFRHVSRPVHSVPFSLCQLMKCVSGIMEKISGTSRKSVFFFYGLHLVAFIELMKNECRCISSQTDVWNVGSLYYFTFLHEVKANYKQTGKYRQMLTEKAGLDGREGIKNRWVNERNDLGGSQALCIWQFVLETRESIPTLPQERFVKAFLKLFEPQRDSATSKGISCFTLFKTYTMALLARLLLSNWTWFS